MLPIKIYIGISKRFECVKHLTANSILRNTKASVDIELLYPVNESGCTGFSNVRFDIRKGIYLDCDMIVLADIAELWSYHKEGKFVCMQDGSTEVAVIDCVHTCKDKTQLNVLPLSKDIPLEWNVEDYKIGTDPIPENAKLVHLTDLNKQPWFHNHPNKYIVELYENYNA